jgi:peptidoglycan/LPS O-acetylase OafA/YrhL
MEPQTIWTIGVLVAGILIVAVCVIARSRIDPSYRLVRIALALLMMLTFIVVGRLNGWSGRH